MKENNDKQSNPTLTELLEPYLRNPPSPPHSPQPTLLQQLPVQQSRQPQSLSVASLHTVQRAPAKPQRHFHTSSPQFYRVHPRDFRALVQTLTGAGSTSNDNRPSTHKERRVEDNNNGTGSEEAPMPPGTGMDYFDWCAPPILSPRTMDSIDDSFPEKNDGESSDMGSFPD